MTAVAKTDSELLWLDPYAGGKDGPDRTFSKVVRTRSAHVCWISADEHPIAVGTRAVRWTWMHRGEFGRHYGCAKCVGECLR